MRLSAKLVKAHFFFNADIGVFNRNTQKCLEYLPLNWGNAWCPIVPILTWPQCLVFAPSVQWLLFTKCWHVFWNNNFSHFRLSLQTTSFCFHKCCTLWTKSASFQRAMCGNICALTEHVQQHICGGTVDISFRALQSRWRDRRKMSTVHLVPFTPPAFASNASSSVIPRVSPPTWSHLPPVTSSHPHSFPHS